MRYIELRGLDRDWSSFWDSVAQSETWGAMLAVHSLWVSYRSIELPGAVNGGSEATPREYKFRCSCQKIRDRSPSCYMAMKARASKTGTHLF